MIALGRTAGHNLRSLSSGCRSGQCHKSSSKTRLSIRRSRNRQSNSDFDTTRPVYATREDKCHISHVVADTDSLDGTASRPIDKPSSGKIAVKVINHYGDEVMKVFDA